MPRSGDQEAGAVSPETGSYRFTLNFLRGFDFEGGHDETKGQDLAGNEITVPLHRHDVSLDFTRIELEAEYTFKKNWSALLRVPYEIKEQEASIDLVTPATLAEQQAMDRRMNLHHSSSGNLDTPEIPGLRSAQKIAKVESKAVAINYITTALRRSGHSVLYAAVRTGCSPAGRPRMGNGQRTLRPVDKGP